MLVALGDQACPQLGAAYKCTSASNFTDAFLSPSYYMENLFLKVSKQLDRLVPDRCWHCGLLSKVDAVHRFATCTFSRIPQQWFLLMLDDEDLQLSSPLGSDVYLVEDDWVAKKLEHRMRCELSDGLGFWRRIDCTNWHGLWVSGRLVLGLDAIEEEFEKEYEVLYDLLGLQWHMPED